MSSTPIETVWEEHIKGEFATGSVEDTLATMTADAHVNHVPVLTGGVGIEECGRFYATSFIPHIPPDFTLTPVSRTVGEERLVDELIVGFTHSQPMDWILPGVPPTGRAVQVPLVAIIHFRDGKVASEHIYWDQASVLSQVGLLDGGTVLPIAGAESARKVLDPLSEPSNTLIERARANG